MINNVPCLSIRQPWAYIILRCGKDIENRTWATKIRGRVLIHASKGGTQAEWDDAWDWAYGSKDDWRRESVPSRAIVQRGGIVGSVEIIDCVTVSGSSWFCGPYGFVLRAPKALPFTPMPGRLGFFYPNLASIRGLGGM